jgi:hypothetical protein
MGGKKWKSVVHVEQLSYSYQAATLVVYMHHLQVQMPHQNEVHPMPIVLDAVLPFLLLLVCPNSMNPFLILFKIICRNASLFGPSRCGGLCIKMPASSLPSGLLTNSIL